MKTPVTIETKGMTTKDHTDYKQIAFKLQTDIDHLKWEQADKDLPFLKEMLGYAQKCREDVVSFEMLETMIEHWIIELEKIHTT